MPNLIGRDLQGAQDAIQSLTHDAICTAARRTSPAKDGHRSWIATAALNGANENLRGR